MMPAWASISLRLADRAGALAAFTLTDAANWNKFARSQLTLDAASGQIVRWEPYSAATPG
jgi:hypothetical protein